MTENDGYVLLALPLLPLAAALMLMLIPNRERSVQIGLTAVVSLVMFGLSLYVFAQYEWGGVQFQAVKAIPWMENVGFLGENGMQLKVGIDGIAATMILLTGIVIVAGTWVSCSPIGDNE